MPALEDMRIFSKVAELHSFTRAAAALGLSKQTVSRRIGALEADLGAILVERTTRSFRITAVGEAYAGRCTEIVRLADEANAAITRPGDPPRGVLRVTAAPLFGEWFLAPVVREYADRHRDARVEVVLTQRRVELVEDGFDVAIRLGHPPDPSLIAVELMPAVMRYCASPEYLDRRGAPHRPEELRDHDCVALMPDGGPPRWLFSGPSGAFTRAVPARIVVNNLSMAHRATLDGIGIGNLPAFACDDELRDGRLVSVLDEWTGNYGHVHAVYSANRALAARVRAFVDLLVEQLAGEPPWVM